MKTAVEWLIEQLPKGDFDHQQIVIAQAMEKEKQQQDDLAIGFAKWVTGLDLSKKLLEIYKKTL